MAKRVPPEYLRVLAEHRRRLSRLADRRGVAQLRKIYEEAVRELEKRLAAVPGTRRARFTPQQQRLFLGQLRQGVALIIKRMAGGLGDISRDVQTDALRSLIDDVGKLEGKFTGAAIVLPVEEAAKFQGVVSGVRETMLRSHETSMAKYGARLIKAMEDQLSAAVLVGDDVGSAIERVKSAADLEWWQAERVTRTEMIWAYNATHQSGMRETAKELPDMMMRWTEYVTDTSPSGMDQRVDVDSIAMHGQVAPPGGSFYFPNTLPEGAQLNAEQRKRWPGVQRRFAGKSWAHPPNRPNDRSSIAPWRPHWGVPAWRWEGGRRVQL